MIMSHKAKKNIGHLYNIDDYQMLFSYKKQTFLYTLLKEPYKTGSYHRMLVICLLFDELISLLSLSIAIK